jgi:hypothetical protein
MKNKFIIGAGVVMLIASAALPAFAEGTNSTPTSTATSTSIKQDEGMKHAMNVACVATAVDVREVAVATGYSSFSAAINAALTARGVALHSAWAITTANDRNTAIKAAWQAFRGSTKTARQNLKQATRAAWNTFATARKACGGRGNLEESAGQAGDNSL